ncbi:MAG: hypothetical protein MJ238_05080 [Bacilli bacterium]|nr:hypothetical protein [Bacilli bacterium]
MVNPIFEYKVSERFLQIWSQVFKESIKPNKDTYTIYLTVLLNEMPISCCEIVEIDPENYLVQNIAVLPPLRHQMIAQYTLRFAETKIRDIGGMNSVVRVEPQYEGHYKKLGFHEHLDGEIILENNIKKIEMIRVLRIKKSRKKRD